MDISIINRYNSGEAFTKIAKSINKSANYVKNILLKNNLNIPLWRNTVNLFTLDLPVKILIIPPYLLAYSWAWMRLLYLPTKTFWSNLIPVLPYGKPSHY